MAAFVRALYAYHQGDLGASYQVLRDDGYTQMVPVALHFDGNYFTAVDRLALEHCQGRILDVGAGGGRHATLLAQRGLDVTALEIEEDLAPILHARGLKAVVTADIMTFEAPAFDTLLMLMNGIGMAATPQGLDRLLARLPKLLSSSGRLLCDSLDVSLSDNPVHRAYREANRQAGRYPGQQVLQLEFEGQRGPVFSWLHLAADQLKQHCDSAGLHLEVLAQEDSGHYLASIHLEQRK